MSGAMRKMGVYLGLLEDADGEYAELDNSYDEPARRTPEQAAAPAAPRPVSSISERRRTSAPSGAPETAATALSRITTLHPRTYNEARVIGENFRDGIPVIMNLSVMS
jgi:cell division inhibitor SepF